MAWAGGSSEFALISGDQIGLGIPSAGLTTSQFGIGYAIWRRISSEMSTDFQGITGWFAGAGATPYGFAAPFAGGGGGSSVAIGLKPGDVVINVPSTVAAIPGRVTLHAVLASTANFSTGTFKSTGGWDVTLGPSSTL
jgi:hypothetical protein